MENVLWPQLAKKVHFHRVADTRLQLIWWRKPFSGVYLNIVTADGRNHQNRRGIDIEVLSIFLWCVRRVAQALPAPRSAGSRFLA